MLISDLVYVISEALPTSDLVPDISEEFPSDLVPDISEDIHNLVPDISEDIPQRPDVQDYHGDDTYRIVQILTIDSQLDWSPLYPLVPQTTLSSAATLWITGVSDLYVCWRFNRDSVVLFIVISLSHILILFEGFVFVRARPYFCILLNTVSKCQRASKCHELQNKVNTSAHQSYHATMPSSKAQCTLKNP